MKHNAISRSLCLPNMEPKMNISLPSKAFVLPCQNTATLVANHQRPSIASWKLFRTVPRQSRANQRCRVSMSKYVPIGDGKTEIEIDDSFDRRNKSAQQQSQQDQQSDDEDIQIVMEPSDFYIVEELTSFASNPFPDVVLLDNSLEQLRLLEAMRREQEEEMRRLVEERNRNRSWAEKIGDGAKDVAAYGLAAMLLGLLAIISVEFLRTAFFVGAFLFVIGVVYRLLSSL